MNPKVGPNYLYMGLHFINDASLITMEQDINDDREPGLKERVYNVKLNKDYTLEVTADVIKKGHELLLKYFKKPVYNSVKKVTNNVTKKNTKKGKKVST